MMTDMRFGEIIEKLMYFSGEKNYTLAKSLGYDVSYISKWISGTMLPTHKNIKIISNKIANFILENTNKSSRSEIIDYFKINIDLKEDGGDKLLKEYIEDLLNESYLINRQKNNTNYQAKKCEDINTRYNSMLAVKPTYKKQQIHKSIMSNLSDETESEVIVLSDLFNLNREDKINILGIKNGIPLECDIKNTKIRFLINFEDDVDDIIFDSLLFINIITRYSNIDFKIYNCNQSKYSVTLVVKNHSFTSITYTVDKNCLFINTSKDKSIVNDMYKCLNEMKRSKSEVVLQEISNIKLILNKVYMQYILGINLRWVIGNVNELLMPTDLFLDIGKKVFGEDEEVINELKNINGLWQKIIGNSNIKIIMYRNAIKNYMLNGKLSFFNHTVELNLEQKKKHMEYMKKTFIENKNIDIKLITDDLVEDFRDMKNPSLFLSESISFIKVTFEDTGNVNKYQLIKNYKLIKIFDEFFEELWNKENYNVTLTKEQAIDRLCNLLKYIDILNDIKNEK